MTIRETPSLTNWADRYVHICRHRAPCAPEVACQEKEPESRNSEMGTIQHRGTLPRIQFLPISPVLTPRQRTVKFINDDAASIHGSLRVASIYTSESGEWKLGGFEVLSSVKDDDAVIYVGQMFPGTWACLVADNGRHTAASSLTRVVTLLLNSPSRAGTP